MTRSAHPTPEEEHRLPADAVAATRALLQAWQQEDAADTDVSDEQAQAELEELKSGLNEPRAGARLLFPEGPE